jgi:hypothetical protein
MNDRREITDKEGDKIDLAARIADQIFRHAVKRTAKLMDIPHFNEDQSSIRSVCETYPQVVAGFMRVISTVYAASTVTESSLEAIEQGIADLDV